MEEQKKIEIIKKAREEGIEEKSLREGIKKYKKEIKFSPYTGEELVLRIIQYAIWVQNGKPKIFAPGSGKIAISCGGII